MALRIHCDKCHKRISIDEAFAGGVCCCPYCREINYVPTVAGPVEQTPRPAAPQMRPQAPGPGAPPGADETQAQPQPASARRAQTIPVADPIKVQGILTIIMLAALAVILVGVVWLGVSVFGGDAADTDDYQPPPKRANPFEAPADTGAAPKGPVVAADVEIEPPVVYCIDGGSSMRETFDYAVAMTLASVRTLGAKRKFGAVVVAEGSISVMPGGLTQAGRVGLAGCEDFLGEQIASGATDMDAGVREALKLKPRTIVLFSRKGVDDAASVASSAKEAGVVVVTVSTASHDAARESLAKLAEATGGTARAFTLGQLESFASQP